MRCRAARKRVDMKQWESQRSEYSVLDAVSHNAALVLHMGMNLGEKVAIDRSGVAWVDGLIERNRSEWDEQDRKRLTRLLGSFVGEAMIAEFGGRWIWGHGLGVDIGEQFVAFPLARVGEWIDGGEGDSVLGFFDASSAMLDQQRPGS